MAKRFYDDTEYGIGRTLATVIKLRDLKVAPPDQVVYVPASVYYVRGDRTRVGDGISRVEWIWDVISLDRLSTLLDYLDGADYASVYIHTDKRDGTFPNPRTSFATFSVIMWKPHVFGREGVHVATSPYTLQTVKLTFVNLEEVGDYL